MNPTIGIMQGRLSLPSLGKIQSFPVDTWREEFPKARDAGLNCIEWIYETGTDADNPLRTDDGIAEICKQFEATGVRVESVCADYYMSERLVSHDGAPREEVVQHLIWLLGRTAALGAKRVVLPFVDDSSLRTNEEIDGFVEVMQAVITSANKFGISLHLETDLPATVLESALRSRIESPLVRVTYDVGNEASLGHDPQQDLPLLGRWLGSVHIKDRVLGGTTVPLGTGSADFATCFRMFEHVGYDGSFILQAARGAEGDEVGLAKQNRVFVLDGIDTVQM